MWWGGGWGGEGLGGTWPRCLPATSGQAARREDPSYRVPASANAIVLHVLLVPCARLLEVEQCTDQIGNDYRRRP